MFKFTPLFITSLSVTFILLPDAVLGYGSHHCGWRDWIFIKHRMKTMIASSSNPKEWPGRLLRAGFHDCLPKSCDSSIQFELDRPDNANIEATINFLKKVKGESCVALSDTLKIGMQVSMELSRGVKFRCPLGNRADATQVNPDGQIPRVQDDVATMIRKFVDKGFTIPEALAGNYGGHSIGVFRPPSRRVFPFTPEIDRYGNNFARFIFGLPQSATNPFYAGFNHLPSDQRLAVEYRRIVELFAKDRKILDHQFRKFLTKLCKL